MLQAAGCPESSKIAGIAIGSEYLDGDEPVDSWIEPQVDMAETTASEVSTDLVSPYSVRRHNGEIIQDIGGRFRRMLAHHSAQVGDGRGTMASFKGTNSHKASVSLVNSDQLDKLELVAL